MNRAHLNFEKERFMKALCWFGKHDVRVENVPDPKILNSRDAIIKITSTAICGSDLHLYNGLIPTMQTGDILGHEFMREVVETGSAITNLRVGGCRGGGRWVSGGGSPGVAGGPRRSAAGRR